MWALTLLLAAGCQKAAPPEAPVPPAAIGPGGSHVTVATGLTAPPAAGGGKQAERQAMLKVLREADTACRVCYERAIARDPWIYGDIEVRVTLDADGGVADAVARYSTLGDAELEDCVLERVRLLQFPHPSKAGLTLSYPFVFTSDLTPSEVTRALLVRHGLAVPVADLPPDFNPDEEPEPARGEEGWWETW
jgi:outer membrane biosynthesis protein TonB